MQTEVAAVSVKHTNVSDAERAAQMGGRASFLMAAACLFCFPALHPRSPLCCPVLGGPKV